MSAHDTTRSAGAALPHLIVSVALTGMAAALGAVASVDAAAFYAQLDQPGWAPPPWLFGPVWSLLYLMMAVAAWRIAGVARPGLEADGARFHAGDYIADYIESGELDELLDQVSLRMQGVLAAAAVLGRA